MAPSRIRRSRTMALISSRSAWLGANNPTLARSAGESLCQRGRRTGEIIGLHFRDVGPELLERPADFTREEGLDRGLQFGIALAPDLVHNRGLYARLLQLRERLASIDGVGLFLVADQDYPGEAQDTRDPQLVAGLNSRGERDLVDHQRGFLERSVVRRCIVTPQNRPGSMGCRADRRRTSTPNNSNHQRAQSKSDISVSRDDAEFCNA